MGPRLTAVVESEAFRFVVLGGVNTVVTWLLNVALLEVLPSTVAYSLTYAAGIVLAYALNARFVFDAPMSFRTFVRFPSVYVVQYLLGLVLLRVLVDMLGLDERLVLLAIPVLTLPVTFAMSRAILRATERGRGA